MTPLLRSCLLTCLSEFKIDGRSVLAEFLFDFVFVFVFWATEREFREFEMVLAQKVMALHQTLQQLNCSRAIDLDPCVAHSVEFQDLLNVYTSQTALEELAQIVSTRSNLVRMRLMRNRRRRLLVRCQQTDCSENLQAS